MRAKTTIAVLLALLLSLAGVASAQEERSADTAAVQPIDLGSRATEETLVYRLPVRPEADDAPAYEVTITGERLVSRTLLKFSIVDANGAPLPADTPVRIALEMNGYNPETFEELPPETLDIPPVYQDGVWVVGPFSPGSFGYLTGQLDVGEGENTASAEFNIGIYPNAPELPGWFIPLNLAIPAIALLIIIGLIVGRRLPLWQPARPQAA